MDCDLVNTGFTGESDNPLVCENQFMRSMDELVPEFEREGIKLDIQARRYAFCERNNESVDIVRSGSRVNQLPLRGAAHLLFMTTAKAISPRCSSMPGRS